MEVKTAKALDRIALKLKRKRATQYDAHICGASQPTNGVVKQIKLGEYCKKIANSGSHIGQSLNKRFLSYKKSGIPAQLMFYKDGEWLDFPNNILDLVKKDLEMKNSVVEWKLREFSEESNSLVKGIRIDTKQDLYTPNLA
ncbi:unnamed protein product [Sphenostylis stenocarpa]|uniref:RCD1 WWE domain-containing protein n=1 Tax=Sphenostylis stenocarpa TaxID=92480 RepID=A0AA86T1D5_9FABA|nr:unnamed protein product [Sphenostylis stenocarpa]